MCRGYSATMKTEVSVALHDAMAVDDFTERDPADAVR
jgi:hypothetical protein